VRSPEWRCSAWLDKYMYTIVVPSRLAATVSTTWLQMIPRFPSQSISSFISPYAGARQQIKRSLSSYRIRSPHVQTLIPRSQYGQRHKTRTKRVFHSSAALSAQVKNPYEVLGVNKDASAAEIKKTYFSLARKYHPDTNPDKDAQVKFVEIQEAYDVCFPFSNFTIHFTRPRF